MSAEVSVLDRNDNLVAELKAENITVKENGRPQVVVSLQAISSPQSVCILVDTSGSMYDQKDDARATVMQLLHGLPLKDETCIATFGWTLKMEQPLTLDRPSAAKVARRQLHFSGGTALLDQLLRMEEYMRTTAKFQSRAIVVITDAADNASVAQSAEVKQRMEMPGSPRVHFLILPALPGNRSRPEEAHIKRDTLQLTEVGGGFAYFPTNTKDLQAAVDHLDDVLRRRYLLQYESTNPAGDGKERHVESKATAQGQKLTVRGPQLYVAPAQ